MPGEFRDISRRRFVQATLTSTAALGGVSSVDARQSTNSSQYTVIQDGKCIPIEPLTMSGLPVKQFYGYRTPSTKPRSYNYASFGTENLQRSETSILFLYKGPKGLSLVAIHDKIDAGSGGAVTFRLTNLPADGKFVVKDDDYNGSTNVDTWDYSTHRSWNGKKTATASISWAYSAGRSDGMVYRGLGNDFEVTIHPQFNQQAILSGQNQGKIKLWQILSGNASNPTRTKLDMSKPITISSKPCQSKTTTRQTAQTPRNKNDSKATTTQQQSPKNTNTEPSFFDQLWNDFSSFFNHIF
ncbi:hypothetical protein [Haladaptatus salinisoli]|uniref:hypothetical protein n=1 Tax=Haladaptatus salinisoli TaxID=2884876 RepID=UPI001D0B4CF1|nr:hypothetical protein [Haladaptatus salinisoli]